MRVGEEEGEDREGGGGEEEDMEFRQEAGVRSRN